MNNKKTENRIAGNKQDTLHSTGIHNTLDPSVDKHNMRYARLSAVEGTYATCSLIFPVQ